MSVLSTNIYKLSFNPSRTSLRKLELNNYLNLQSKYRLCEKTAPHLHKPKPHFDISGQKLQIKGIKTELDMDTFIFLGEHYQHISLLTLFSGSRSQCSCLNLTPAVTALLLLASGHVQAKMISISQHTPQKRPCNYRYSRENFDFENVCVL